MMCSHTHGRIVFAIINLNYYSINRNTSFQAPFFYLFYCCIFFVISIKTNRRKKREFFLQSIKIFASDYVPSPKFQFSFCALICIKQTDTTCGKISWIRIFSRKIILKIRFSTKNFSIYNKIIFNINCFRDGFNYLCIMSNIFSNFSIPARFSSYKDSILIQ